MATAGYPTGRNSDGGASRDGRASRRRGGPEERQGCRIVSCPLRAGAPISGEELDAVGLAAAPDDFAFLALGMIGDQRQHEPVPDVDRHVHHDPRAARRDVEYRARAPGDAIVDRDPGGMVVEVAARLALDLN